MWFIQHTKSPLPRSDFGQSQLTAQIEPSPIGTLRPSDSNKPSVRQTPLRKASVSDSEKEELVEEAYNVLLESLGPLSEFESDHVKVLGRTDDGGSLLLHIPALPSDLYYSFTEEGRTYLTETKAFTRHEIEEKLKVLEERLYVFSEDHYIIGQSTVGTDILTVNGILSSRPDLFKLSITRNNEYGEGITQEGPESHSYYIRSDDPVFTTRFGHLFR